MTGTDYFVEIHEPPISRVPDSSDQCHPVMTSQLTSIEMRKLTSVEGTAAMPDDTYVQVYEPRLPRRPGPEQVDVTDDIHTQRSDDISRAI